MESNPAGLVSAIDTILRKRFKDKLVILEKVNCKICGSAASPLFVRQGGHKVFICTACRVQQIEHDQTLKELEVLEKEYYRSKNRKRLEGFDRHPRWDREVQIINRLVPEGGRLLDIGCSSGDFLAELDDRWEKLGIEPNEERASIARSRGLEVLEEEFHEANLGRKFDVVTFYEVIEHLIEFNSTIDGINSILKEGGLFVLSTPDVESISARLRGLDWWSYKNPVHLFFFGHSNLTQILAEKNFRVVKKRYNLQGNQFQNPFLKWLQFLLEDNAPLYRRIPLGDRMFVYSRKISA